MKYEYGVEYPCNGKKPDLPGDVLVEQCYSGHWYRQAKQVNKWVSWLDVTAFRIVDERYNWHARGELPPVGVECEVEYNSAEIKKKFHRVIPVFYSKSLAIFEDVRGGEVAYFIKCCKFRPIRTDREKFIEAAMSVGELRGRDGAKEVYGRLFDAGFKAPEPQ